MKKIAIPDGHAANDSALDPVLDWILRYMRRFILVGLVFWALMVIWALSL